MDDCKLRVHSKCFLNCLWGNITHRRSELYANLLIYVLCVLMVFFVLNFSSKNHKKKEIKPKTVTQIVTF